MQEGTEILHGVVKRELGIICYVLQGPVRVLGEMSLDDRGEETL